MNQKTAVSDGFVNGGLVKQKGRVLKRHIFKILIFAVPLCFALAILWRYYEPRLYIRELASAVDDNADTKIASQRLVSLGPRAIGPILQQIGERGPYSKSAAALPSVLAQLGAPAHQQILTAIDGEAEYHRRSYYIYTLQTAFHDYSRLPHWLDEAQHYPSDYRTIHRSLQITFGFDVPPIRSEDEKIFNPEFLEWYDKHRSPKGVLPLWKSADRNQ